MKRLNSSSHDRVLFSVRLLPRASRSEVVGGSGDGALRIRITAPPVEEAANRELIRFLAKTLGIRKSDLRIVAGTHSRSKRIEVPNSCKNRLLSFEDI